MPTGHTAVGGSPVPGRDADGPEGSERTGVPAGTGAGEICDSPGAGGFAWELPPEAELLLPVEIQPWGDQALAVVLRSGARVVELLSVLCFLPEDAVVEGVYGDVEFAVVFETPPGTEG
jgi:hypothetical protein